MAQPLDRPRAERRRQQLQAMGIQPWRLRRESGPAAGATPDAAEIGCIVLVPQGCPTRIRDLLARALQAGGPVLARIGCVSVESAGMTLVPAATYLLLDAGLEPMLASRHPQSARHVLGDPAQLLTAAGKRWLWQALRSIRQQLSAAGDLA